MSRAKREFTEEEVRILASNPYTYRITAKTIRFTLAFKEEFWKRDKEGYSVKQIFTDLGYDYEILGKRRCEGIRQHIVKEITTHGQLHEGSLFPKIKPSARDYTTLPEGKAIEYMQHELLYLRQEVEFLKKIISQDNEARRKK